MMTSGDTCYSTLRREILSGSFAPGERLPPERKLAENFGVGRVTVRSALTRLAAANLLSVRQGSGYVVQNYRREGGPDLLRDVVEIAAHSGAFLDMARDLLHVRRHLARAVLERVAERAPTVDIRARFTRAVDAFEADMDGDLEILVQRDLDILSVLLDATGSPVLGLCINPISSVLRAFPQLGKAMYSEPRENLMGWRLLAEALSGGETMDAETLVGFLEQRDIQTLEAVAAAERRV